MTLEYTAAFAESPECVFAALTNPAEIIRWWGDDSVYRMTDVRQDLHAGGEAVYCGKFSNGTEFGSIGVTRASDAPRMLEYTRRYTGGVPCVEETVIRYELEQRESGTMLRITHSGFESEEMVEQHRLGWQRVCDWLSQYLRLAGPIRSNR